MPRIKYTPPRSFKPNCFWLGASSVHHREFVAADENKENGPKENSIFLRKPFYASQDGSYAFGTMYKNLQNIMAGGEDEKDPELICVLCGQVSKTIHHSIQHYFQCMIEKQIEIVYCTKPLCMNRGLEKYHFHYISERVHTTQKPDSISENLVGVVETGVGGSSKQCTGEKPFECSTCNKSFVTKAGHDRHILIHTIRRKPYERKTKTTFYTKTSLKRQQAIHAKKKVNFLRNHIY